MRGRGTWWMMEKVLWNRIELDSGQKEREREREERERERERRRKSKR